MIMSKRVKSGCCLVVFCAAFPLHLLMSQDWWQSSRKGDCGLDDGKKGFINKYRENFWIIL